MANYSFKDDANEAAPADTLTHRVYETLRDEIVDCVLKPGDRLVRKKVAERLGVSPMPVTEALYMLEVDGLVESRPLHGCRVRLLTLADVQDAFVLREALECHSARLCAEKASDADMARLNRLAVQLDRVEAEADPNSRLGMQLHLDFHLGVAEASGFRSLADELRRVWFQRYMHLNWLTSTVFAPVPADWHQQLMRGIRSRDPEQAEASMRKHVRYGQGSGKEALERYLEQTVNKGNRG